MRQLNLKPYNVSVPQPSKTAPGSVESVDVPFDVTRSIVAVLFGAGVDGRELLKRDSLAKKIEGAKAKSVLLEEEEYQTVLSAFRAWKTFGRNEVELINRIENAPTVNVRPAKK